MKSLLICPGKHEGVAALAEGVPLSNIQILGKGLVEYWLEYLVSLGAREIDIAAADRPEQVSALVGNGSRWGIRAIVKPERLELSAEEARARYGGEQGPWLPCPHDVTLCNRLPGLPELPLTTSYADWFMAVQAWMPRAATPDRIGIHEIIPGVWSGLHTHISPEAHLRAPCWLGENVYVEAGTVIGPNAVLENEVFVDRGAEVSYSVVGPRTFVGQFVELRHSIAGQLARELGIRLAFEGA